MRCVVLHNGSSCVYGGESCYVVERRGVIQGGGSGAGEKGLVDGLE